jgi:hypothetical protein
LQRKKERFFLRSGFNFPLSSAKREIKNILKILLILSNKNFQTSRPPFIPTGKPEAPSEIRIGLDPRNFENHKFMKLKNGTKRLIP